MSLHHELKKYQVIYVAITAFVMYEFYNLSQFMYDNFNGWDNQFTAAFTAMVAAVSAMLKWALENSRQDTRGDQ